jgi:hypothetical protein
VRQQPVQAGSNAVSGAAAFSHTTPWDVGMRRTVAHGRTRGCSTGPVRSMPAAARRASAQAVAARRQALVSHPLTAGHATRLTV